ncbi:hypothetical protein [Methanosarcina barkeri]|nr:hypothetical protein [Methanosarcina barkeri]
MKLKSINPYTEKVNWLMIPFLLGNAEPVLRNPELLFRYGVHCL